jgi:NAD(P)-dependent dehydrogenase (short-subunit alcohol dehydrogenase family)
MLARRPGLALAAAGVVGWRGGGAADMTGVLEQFRLDGRVALVTGAGSGLGRALALAMAEAGAAVGCLDLDGTAAEATAEQVRGLGRRAAAVSASVTNEDDLARAVPAVAAELGGLDIAFANAGVAERRYPLVEAPLTEWQKIIDVDLTGVFLTAREVARVMTPRGRGKIIATASIMGLVGHFEGTPRAYSAAKGGVVNLVRALAVELAPHNIQVNALAPTFLQTNIAGGLLAGETEESRAFLVRVRDRTPIGRLGQPEEVAGAAVFLASDASNLVTGVTLPVDGGWTAW